MDDKEIADKAFETPAKTEAEPEKPEEPKEPEEPEQPLSEEEQQHRTRIDEQNAATERTEKANKEKAALLDREEKLLAEKERIGRGQIIPKTTPAPMTDKEYWQSLKKGELPKTSPKS